MKNLLKTLKVATVALMLAAVMPQAEAASPNFGYATSNLLAIAGTQTITAAGVAGGTNALSSFSGGRFQLSRQEDLAVSINTSGLSATNSVAVVDLGLSADGTNFAYRVTGVVAGYPPANPSGLITLTIPLTNGPTWFHTNVPKSVFGGFRWVKPVGAVSTNTAAVYVTNITVGTYRQLP